MNPIVDAVSEKAEGRDPNTGQFLKLNRAAEVHGATTAERHGFAPEIAEMLETYRAQVIADLGGAENIGAIKRAYVDNLVNISGLIQMLSNYLRVAGPLTARGRQRSSVATLLSACATFDRLANRLGLERRPKHVPHNIEEFMAQRDVEGDE